MKNSDPKNKDQMVLSVAEAASVLGVSTKVVYTLAHRADFPAFRVGKRFLISKKGLDAWIQNQSKCPVT